ncbi:hypothetical protein MY4038_008589 [Beauveria bassiana]
MSTEENTSSENSHHDEDIEMLDYFDTSDNESARLAGAVRALDSVIQGKAEPFLPPRFGYVQLFDFLESLKSNIQLHNYCGSIDTKPHQTIAAIAYELYRNAQDTPTATGRLRRFRLVGGRWKDAIRSSPLLLLAFSKTAASFAEDPTKADNQTTRILLLKALDDVPDQLKNVCTKLSDIANLEVIGALAKYRAA